MRRSIGLPVAYQIDVSLFKNFYHLIQNAAAAAGSACDAAPPATFFRRFIN
jgi:hypothetical protein